MESAALGFRMHSGWGVLVAVSGAADSVAVVDRRRIVVADPSAPGGNQPYHFAANLSGNDCEEFIAKCRDRTERMAFSAIKESLHELQQRKYRVTLAAVLMASGRALPSLSQILASHPLIHTAEGEFFRTAVITACGKLDLTTAQVREREIEEIARSAYGGKAASVSRKISTVGASIGPPWTADHKAAALAALMTLKNS
jgi:hypothetical protein